MKKKATASTRNSNGKKHPGRPENLKPWPKGVSGNPKGAPKRGESWAEIIKRYCEMTPSQAATESLELTKRFLSIGDGVTLKQAVILRVYASLLFEPQPGLFNAFMERTEGKITQPIDFSWREEAIKLGLDPDAIVERVGPLFAKVPVEVEEPGE